MINGVVITYGDIAIGAKETFVPSMQDIKPFSDINILKQNALTFDNFANPCELFQTPLDGSLEPFPDDISEYKMNIWSQYVSESDGTFVNPPQLVLQTAGQQFASQGFTITFDEKNNIFCTDLLIEWYRDGEIIDTFEFYPDAVTYFCGHFVSYFDKVVMTFKKINYPRNYLRLQEIVYGYGTEFTSKELRSVNVNQSLDPLSTELKINTVDFTVDSKRDFEFSFQKNQPVTVYFDGRLIAKHYIKSSKRIARKMWTVKTENEISVLESTEFPGDIYNNKDARELFDEILTKAGVEYEITDEFDGELVTGYIPYTNCREALMQLAFVTDAVINSAYSDKLRIYKLNNEISQTIPKSRIKQGQNFEDEEIVTGVEVVSHRYTKSFELVEYDWSDFEETETEKEVIVKFDVPTGYLSIEKGTILESTATYARLKARQNTILTGIKYRDRTTIKRKTNPTVLVSDSERVITIDGATLVNASNVDRILDKCFDYYMNTTTTNVSIVDGKHIVEEQINEDGSVTPKEVVYDKQTEVGDKIIISTEFLGDRTGRIISQRFDLNGGIINKETVMR
jgi:hypothetical protein